MIIFLDRVVRLNSIFMYIYDAIYLTMLNGYADCISFRVGLSRIIKSDSNILRFDSEDPSCAKMVNSPSLMDFLHDRA